MEIIFNEISLSFILQMVIVRNICDIEIIINYYTIIKYNLVKKDKMYVT